MNFYMPTRLFTGENCVSRNSGLFASCGSRCLIISGKHAAKESGALEDVLKVLEETGISVSVYDGVTQNPPLAACMEAGGMARDTGAEFLIGIGGGSSLDAAKAASVFAANEGLDEAGFYSGVWPNTPLPVILVGTTSGTGSEMTRVAVLTDSRGRKHSIKNDLLSPVFSFGDSRYTENMSLPLTLTTGVDALAHCLESSSGTSTGNLSNHRHIGSVGFPSERAIDMEINQSLYGLMTLTGRIHCIAANLVGVRNLTGEVGGSPAIGGRELTDIVIIGDNGDDVSGLPLEGAGIVG